MTAQPVWYRQARLVLLQPGSMLLTGTVPGLDCPLAPCAPGGRIVCSGRMQRSQEGHMGWVVAGVLAVVGIPAVVYCVHLWRQLQWRKG
jgi:hypothetical protein